MQMLSDCKISVQILSKEFDKFTCFICYIISLLLRAIRKWKLLIWTNKDFKNEIHNIICNSSNYYVN